MFSRPASRLRSAVLPVFVSFLILNFCVSVMRAQVSGGAAGAVQPVKQADRIAVSPDLAPLTRLSGHLPAWARVENQSAEGAIDLGATMHLSVVLRRDPAAQAAFDQMLADQQNPASLSYHQWLTLEQMGQLYGPTQNDLSAVRSWLSSQGLKVDSVAPSGVIVQVSGTVAMVGNAFHTTFARFRVASMSRLSATSEPAIPSALTRVIRSIHGLAQTHYAPQSTMRLQQLLPASSKPQVNLGGGEHAILPDDFAAIYDIASVYTGGDFGATIGSAAQHIAVIGRSRVVASDISNYEALAGYPTIQPNVVLAGTDPGVATGKNMGDASEATLDVDRVIGTAEGAQVDLVISADSMTQDGVDIAMDYNINTLKDPVMSISFGSCEAENGSADTIALDTEFQTAAAEGISTFISAGDSGAAGCEEAFTPVTATENQTASINALCASSYVTCVGGTEFNDTMAPYWSTTDSSNGNQSAYEYIPEGAWNEPSTTSTSGATTTTTYAPASGGGGASVFVARPSWQTGTGVPAGMFRDVPDVSFSASNHDGYVACFAANGGTCVSSANGTPIEIFGGTSAAAPGMAGVAALLNTKLGGKQGNINPLLYELAATNPMVFHDVTVASSGVSDCVASTPSMCNNSTPAATSLTGGLAGYQVTAGYDEATGLGSVDVANLLAASSPAAALVSTTLTVAAAANPIVAGQSTTFTATLTPGTSSSAPTGTVQFYANGAAIGSAVTLSGDTAMSASQTFPTAGTDDITAVYSGDTNFAAATSPELSLIVEAATATGTFRLDVSPIALSAAPQINTSSTSTSVVTVTSLNALTGGVALSCTVTPITATPPTCSLSLASVTLAANGTASSTLSIVSSGGSSACSTSEVRKPSWFAGASGGVVLASLALFLFPGQRRRRLLRGMAMACVMVIGLGCLGGCGGSNASTACPAVVSGGTTAGSYIVRVTGVSGTVQQDAVVTITVN
jgi:pseudomonalisin